MFFLLGFKIVEGFYCIQNTSNRKLEEGFRQKISFSE